MSKQTFHTEEAPAAIGTYSQAVRAGDIVYLSGQIPLDPATMELVSDDFTEQAHQAFQNLMQVIQAAGGNADNIMKLTIYLTDLANFPIVNEVMAEYVTDPYPARAALGVSQLPKGAAIEIEGILVLDR